MDQNQVLIFMGSNEKNDGVLLCSNFPQMPVMDTFGQNHVDTELKLFLN
jgi:hypothetical protein